MNSGPAGTSGFEHTQGAPNESSALTEAAAVPAGEPFETAHDETTVPQDETTVAPEFNRSESRMSQAQSMSRSGTLKKKASIKRVGSIGRSASKRSSYAGSEHLRLGDGAVGGAGVGAGEKVLTDEENTSPFFCPVPTTGNPTELLAARFQGKPVQPHCGSVH